MSADRGEGGAVAAGMSAEFVKGLQEAIQRANDAIARTAVAKANMKLAQAQGFVAEHWHAGTFNIDAYKKGLSHLLEAVVPESTSHGAADIVVRAKKTGEVLQAIQAKYNQTAGETMQQLSKTKYDGMHAKLVPEGQGATVRDLATQRAETWKGINADKEYSAQHTAQTANETINQDSVSSTAASREHMENVTQRAQRGKSPIVMDDVFTWREVAGKAAIGGAVGAGIGFAIAAAPHVLSAARAWKQGQRLSDAEFQRILLDGAKDASLAALWSGLQGAVASALVHAAARGALGSALAAIGPGPVGAVTVLAVQGLREGIALYRGDITVGEFADRMITTAAVSAGGVAGAAIGQALIPVPVVGALVGSMVGSLAARGGVEVVRWTFQQILPGLTAAVEPIALVLWGWDALATQQTAAFDASISEGRAAIKAVRASSWNALAGLRLASIDPAALASAVQDEREKVEAWERFLDSRSGEA